MREIKFRGKRTDVANGKFIYGSYLYLNTEGVNWNEKKDGYKTEVHFIIDEHDYNLPIDPETLGQYTGLKDKNGKEIYEGDILRDNEGVGEVEWIQEHCAYLIFTRNPNLYHNIESDGVLKNTEVIGNIYDNPELLNNE